MSEEGTSRERSRLVDKIRKLRDKAQGTDNPAEADAFMARVVKMMEEHAIEEADLRTQVTQVSLLRFNWIMRYACGWRRNLYGEIAGAFGCYMTWKRGTEIVSTYGLPDHVRESVNVYEDVHMQIVRYARVLFPGSAQRKAQRRAEGGLAFGVADRISSIRSASKSDGKSLILNYEADAQKFARQLNPKLTPVAPKYSGTKEFAIGMANSGAIQVDPQVKK